MQNVILSWLLSLQLLLSAPVPATISTLESTPSAGVQQRLWWGMIDPDLAAWFARIPQEKEEEPILWDFSWRGFLASLFGQRLAKEESIHAPQA